MAALSGYILLCSALSPSEFASELLYSRLRTQNWITHPSSFLFGYSSALAMVKKNLIDWMLLQMHFCECNIGFLNVYRN